jgi:nitrite reductase/ring-hydroxylating ferredoxin subunit
MSNERTVLGRRKLLVLGAGVAAIPACSGEAQGPGGPYAWDPWAPDQDAAGGSSSGPSGSSAGSSSGPSGSSSGYTGNGSSSGAGGSSGGVSSSGTGTSSSGSSSGSSAGGNSGGSSGSSTSSSSSSGGGSCSTSGSVLTLTFAQYPALKSANGSAQVTAQGYSDPYCHGNQIYVVNGPSGYIALSASCTHACCTVSFTGSGFHCPCHGATFDITGKATSFVTAVSLPSLPVCSDADGVYVTI